MKSFYACAHCMYTTRHEEVILKHKNERHGDESQELEFFKIDVTDSEDIENTRRFYEDSCNKLELNIKGGARLHGDSNMKYINECADWGCSCSRKIDSLKYKKIIEPEFGTDRHIALTFFSIWNRYSFVKMMKIYRDKTPPSEHDIEFFLTVMKRLETYAGNDKYCSDLSAGKFFVTYRSGTTTVKCKCSNCKGKNTESDDNTSAADMITVEMDFKADPAARAKSF